MSLPSEIDVAIIGAGAAGLAAARTLGNSNLSVLILEARDRIGGRGHTLMLSNDIVFDAGCGWLHSANKNAFVEVAHDLGIEIDKSPPRWREQIDNAGFPPDAQDEFHAATEAFYARCERGAKSKQDHPASDFLETGNRWNGLIDAISTYVNGAELDRVSVHDQEAYHDTEVNWRARRGYGALIAAFGAPCPVVLNTIVKLIDHSGARIKVETSRGVLTARKVIVTVPTCLLADESIRFSPALPEKVNAAAGLPLGLADKTMLALTDPNAFADGGHVFGASDRAALGSYDIRPFGQPCIEGYFGGSFARELEAAGDGAMAAQSIDEIVSLLGSDMRRILKPLASSRWAQDPFARGSYSHALPGHAGDRAALAQPVEDRLFFAGEATSPHFFSTAHGAYETGVRAAREVVGA